MSVKAFFDTNVLVYAFGPVLTDKSDRATSVLRACSEQSAGYVSSQVVNEFFNVAFRKFRPKMTVNEARLAAHAIFGAFQMVAPSSRMLDLAFDLHQAHSIAWFDSLIVAAAMDARCDVLYTEDLQDGRHFGKLTVVNPFRRGGRES